MAGTRRRPDLLAPASFCHRRRKFSAFPAFKFVKPRSFMENTVKKITILAHLALILSAAAFLAACSDMQTRDSGSDYNSYGGHSGHGGHH